jgi:hypothetical protein
MDGQRGQGGRAAGAPSLLPSLLLLTLQHFLSHHLAKQVLACTQDNPDTRPVFIPAHITPGPVGTEHARLK